MCGVSGEADFHIGVCIALQGEVGVHQAISLSRLEEEVQLEDWGYVEGGHDVDEADIRVRILSASLFLRFLNWQQPTSQQPSLTS